MNGYASYHTLRTREISGRDYLIEWRMGRSGLAVMAPHGGGIEPGTSEVARSIAQGAHSFYHFDGLKRENNGSLHITSTRFDEPVALALAAVSWKIVTIHGCSHDDADIFLGGLDTNFQAACAEALTSAGFIVACHLDFQGLQPENLCNRARSGKGLQLELSSRLRRRLFHRLDRAGRRQPTALFGLLSDTLRRVLTLEALGASSSHENGNLSP